MKKIIPYLIVMFCIESCATKYIYDIGEDENILNPFSDRTTISLNIVGDKVIKGITNSPDFVRAEAKFYVRSAIFSTFERIKAIDLQTIFRSHNIHIRVKVTSITYNEVRDVFASSAVIKSCIELTVLANNISKYKVKCSDKTRGPVVRGNSSSSDFIVKLENSYKVAFYESIYKAVNLAIRTQ